MRYLQTAAILALAWMLVEGALLLREARRTVALMDQRSAQIAALADRTAEEVIQRADARVADALRRADRRLAQTLDLADRRTAQIAATAEALQQDTATVATELRSALAEARSAIADARSAGTVVAARLDYWTNCDANGLCWQGAITDTLLAARRAALTVDRVAPRMAEAAEATSASVAATAQASAETAKNIALITKPAPRWARWAGITLGIAAPAAQVALPFAVRSGIQR